MASVWSGRRRAASVRPTQSPMMSAPPIGHAPPAAAIRLAAGATTDPVAGLDSAI